MSKPEFVREALRTAIRHTHASGEIDPDELLADAAAGRVSDYEPLAYLPADQAEQIRAQRRAAHDMYLRDQTAWVTRDGRRPTRIDEIYALLDHPHQR